ncbi:phage tail protein [Enterococcus cecorum]|uniref:phage tail protein n=1 Tax=Enterococcus cecorum TaxID=44008 RepID=UPI00209BFD68|nr:phage tail protein [Enterococcus cecorum]
MDPEHSLTLGLNEVASQSMQLEWSGTDTILARLFSIANSFGAELEFVTELNDDYSLKRHVINVYKVGNIGKDKTGMPIRVGKSLKVINYTANIDELYTAIRVHGKDGLTIAGLDKKVYDSDKKLLYYTQGDTLYAPQARDRFPAIAHKASDSFICLEGEDTEHSSKESLYAYMLGELKKHSEPKIDYETEGYVDGQIGDRMLLIDSVHYDPPLYLEARISEQTISLLDKSKNKTVFTNYERKKSEIANELLAKMNALIEENKVYDVQILTSNGYSFKNGQGSTTLTARVMDGPREVTNEFSVNWYRETDLIGPDASITVQASSINEKVVYRIIAYKDGVEHGRSELTLINVNDGLQGPQGPKGEQGEQGATGPAGRDGKGVKGYKITYQAGTSGVTYPTGNWSSSIPTVPKGQYLWSKTTLTYTDNTTSDTYSVAYFPVNGATGATGNGISSYTAEFYLSTSKATQSGGSWTTTPPTWSNGKYIWTRYKIGYTNGSTAYTTPHCSSEWEAINEIQVGGRNLLFKTGFFDGDQLSGVVGGGNKINLSKTIITDANSPSGKAYRINKYKKGTENVYGGCYWSMPKKLVAGKKYTWSVYVRGVGTVDAFGPEQGGHKSVKLTDIWTKVSHTFTANSNQYFQFVFYSNTEFDLYFTDLMLEEGNAPTPWSPAPEDTQDQIDQANINISNKVDQNAYNTDQITIWDSINSKMDDAEFRAFQSAMNALKSSYEGFVGEGGRFEKELQNAAAREQKIVQNLGAQVQQLNFINTYIRESEEGIVIGAKGNPMQMLLSKDSLSFMDGGQTVAYFSNQSFYINRGAVVESLQVGVHKLTKIDNNHTVIQYIPQ